MDEAERQAHNEKVRARYRRRAVGDRIADREYLDRINRYIAETRWWQRRERRFWHGAKVGVMSNWPGECLVCGCMHRPRDGCPEDFIAATPVGIFETGDITPLAESRWAVTMPRPDDWPVHPWEDGDDD